MHEISEPYGIAGKQGWKEKALAWAYRFDAFCFLNSNDYKPDSAVTILAVGIKEEIETSVDGLSSVDSLISVDSLSSLAAFKDGLKHLKQNSFGFVSFDLKDELEDGWKNSQNESGQILINDNLKNDQLFQNKSHLKKPEPKRKATIEFPPIWFFTPRFELHFHENTFSIFSEEGNLDNLINEIKKEKSKLNLDKTKDSIHEKIKVKPRRFKIRTGESKESYLNKVRLLKDHIQRGDIYEITFCQEFYAEAVDINPLEAYLKLNEVSPSPFSAFIKMRSQYIISSSMERFMKKEGSLIVSEPIKGTIARAKTQKEDQQNIEFLKTSKKERAENIMIVDLVRNDLSRVAKPGSVHVDELCEIQTYQQVHQMVSKISALVDKGISLPDILEKTFPMGSMTGAPKVKALALIEAYEQRSRGVFSGSAGWIKPNGDFDLNVLIRTILFDAKQKYLSFSTGSAITALSDPEKEYEECLLKASGILQALNEIKSS